MDRGQLYDLAVEYARAYPLRPDKEKMMQLITEAISAARNYVVVSVDSIGKIKGALVAMGGENVWAKKQSCNIMFWATTIPGDGVEMLRRFRKWLDARQVVRVAGFAPDLEVDPRTWMIVKRLGFLPHGGAYLWYRGV
jgi:hypothetical protein